MLDHRDRALEIIEDAKQWPPDDAGTPAALAEAHVHALLHLADQVNLVAYLMNGGHALPFRDDLSPPLATSGRSGS